MIPIRFGFLSLAVAVAIVIISAMMTNQTPDTDHCASHPCHYSDQGPTIHTISYTDKRLRWDNRPDNRLDEYDDEWRILYLTAGVGGHQIVIDKNEDGSPICMALDLVNIGICQTSGLWNLPTLSTSLVFYKRNDWHNHQ
jgi:hypothetical protein